MPRRAIGPASEAILAPARGRATQWVMGQAAGPQRVDSSHVRRYAPRAAIDNKIQAVLYQMRLNPAFTIRPYLCASGCSRWSLFSRLNAPR